MKNPTVVFPEVRKAEIRDVEIPALKREQLLIETEVTAISIGTEMTVFSGDVEPGTHWAKAGFPRQSGYCNVGVVKEVGEGVDRARIGQRVQSYGGHGKYVVQRQELAREVRSDVPSECAVFATLAEIALHGVRRSEIGLGYSVVVYGLGLLGQMAVRFAWLAGARPVLGVDVAEQRLKLLPKEAGVIAVNPRETNVTEVVKEVTRGRMADVVVEFTGNQSLIPGEMKLLRQGGTLAIVSGPRGKTEIDFHDLCVVPSIRILGLHNNSHPSYASAWDPWTKNRDVELFIDMVAEGDFDMKSLISDRIHFSDAPAMYQRLLEDRGSCMGIVMDWTT
ncbi:MAG: hypothetical protein C0404_06805 [Verrucomicrobia bacterium]|nr:hypothetical protein [Verrucomicrobiota bacterium]